MSREEEVGWDSPIATDNTYQHGLSQWFALTEHVTDNTFMYCTFISGQLRCWNVN
jgi:hypothetical protein